MLEQQTFRVVGEEKIHCQACVGRIVTALGRLPGVMDVWASASSQRVVVSFIRGRGSVAGLQARLQDLGYEVATEERS